MKQCDRHGGPWGSDETCSRCTYDDGTARPTSDPGPLGPGQATAAEYQAQLHDLARSHYVYDGEVDGDE